MEVVIVMEVVKVVHTVQLRAKTDNYSRISVFTQKSEFFRIYYQNFVRISEYFGNPKLPPYFDVL